MKSTPRTFHSRDPHLRIFPVIRIVRTLEIKALFSPRRIYRHEDYLTPSYGRMEQAAHHIIPEGLKSPKEAGLQTARLTSVAHVNPDVNEPVFAVDPALRQSAFRLTPIFFPRIASAPSIAAAFSIFSIFPIFGQTVTPKSRYKERDLIHDLRCVQG